MQFTLSYTLYYLPISRTNSTDFAIIQKKFKTLFLSLIKLLSISIQFDEFFLIEFSVFELNKKNEIKNICILHWNEIYILLQLQIFQTNKQ